MLLQKTQIVKTSFRKFPFSLRIYKNFPFFYTVFSKTGKKSSANLSGQIYKAFLCLKFIYCNLQFFQNLVLKLRRQPDRHRYPAVQTVPVQ